MSDHTLNSAPLTGGCQCGAVRFRIEGEPGRASLCHCRMCQKAFGSAFGPLVTATDGVTWTRGAPKHYRSSNKVSRGFCGDCGTPLTFEPDGWPVEVAIGALDDPSLAPPTIQHVLESRLPWLDGIDALPVRPLEDSAEAAAHYASIKSHQHPDHDTDEWPRP
jgi:hypothetical protein